MKWPWGRRKNSPEPAPEPQQVEADDDGYVRGRDLDLEEHVKATNSVMAARDAVNVYLGIVAAHREDGHDCPPYCVPSQLAYFLQLMSPRDLRVMLTVLLKDMVESYWQQQQPENSDEP